MEAEIQEYIDKMKDIQRLILQLIDDDENIEENHQNLIELLTNEKIGENRHQLKILLHLISVISNNHYRSPGFFEKFEKILNFYKNEIKQTFTNYDVFLIFKKNKRILLFLFLEKFINIDITIFTYISKDETQSFYSDYFSKELRPFVDFRYVERSYGLNIDEEKRQIGENDSEICGLIRKDSLDDFIQYVQTNSIDLKKKIKPSIYETNPILDMEEPTLLEYAAFFGSVKIFDYLHQNEIELTSSLWNYAIHGNKLEMIQFLHEKGIKPEADFNEIVLKRAMKCHHNEIAKYIETNLINDDGFTGINAIYGYFDNMIAYCFRYYNFALIPNKFLNKFTFYYACQYGFYLLVEIFLKSSKIDINAKIILMILSLFIKFLNSTKLISFYKKKKFF